MRPGSFLYQSVFGKAQSPSGHISKAFFSSLSHDPVIALGPRFKHHWRYE